MSTLIESFIALVILMLIIKVSKRVFKIAISIFIIYFIYSNYNILVPFLRGIFS